MSVLDFLTIAFSTFFGAAVALLGDRWTRNREARLREESAINNLIMDLAAKRAFLAGGEWDWAPGEMVRVVESILHARLLIRDARLALRPRSSALKHLRQMTRACNTFLEMSEREDDQHLKVALQSLVAEMIIEVSALHSLKPRRILNDAPGSSALHGQ